MNRTTGGVLLAALALTAWSATAPAQAEEAEPGSADGSPTKAVAAPEPDRPGREYAQRVTAQAAAGAAERLLAATKLDLDIRLLGRISLAGEL